MKISALVCLVLLQTLLVNGARHYSPETPMVIVADVCGTNSNDLSQAFMPRSVANPLCKVHRFYQFVNYIAFGTTRLIYLCGNVTIKKLCLLLI